MDRENIRKILNEHHVWPGPYTFKFIVLRADEAQLDTILFGFEVSKKESSSGKYISFTATKVFANSDQVIAVYDKAGAIPRLISL